jgi:hypothetical protein
VNAAEYPFRSFFKITALFDTCGSDYKAKQGYYGLPVDELVVFMYMTAVSIMNRARSNSRTVSSLIKFFILCIFTPDWLLGELKLTFENSNMQSLWKLLFFLKVFRITEPTIGF